MAYISKEEKTQKITALKAAFPKLKFSARIEHHSTLIITISDTAMFLESREEAKQKAHQWFINMDREPKFPAENNDQFSLASKYSKIWQIANEGNFDHSDSMTDYYNIGFYLQINVKRSKETIKKAA